MIMANATVLNISISAPDIQGLQHSTLAALIREKYNLCSENMNCNLEVSLPWDPFVMLRNELIEAKATLHSELKLCYTKTLESSMLDDDLVIIGIGDAAGSVL